MAQGGPMVNPPNYFALLQQEQQDMSKKVFNENWPSRSGINVMLTNLDELNEWMNWGVKNKFLMYQEC